MKKLYHKKMTSEAPMYVYATEMVGNYYSRLEISGKKVLSIVGSGDQVIDAYFFGASEVVGFDINKRAFFMLDLKVAAISNLEYAEFIKFFGKNAVSGTLDFVLYEKLRKNLSLRTKKFFDGLYEEFGNSGKRIIKSEYFRQRSMITARATEINGYLKNKKSYKKCREIIQGRKLEFLQLDINDILVTDKLKGQFDIINLSNVLNYLTGNTKDKYLVEVLLNIMKRVRSRVEEDGLFFYYSYSPDLYVSEKRAVPPASRLRLIKEIEKRGGIKIVSKKFKGVNKGTMDRVNIVKI